MKKIFAFIVLLCLANSYALLAQTNKSDSINIAKKAAERENQRKAAEAKALKTLNDKLEKARKDSLAAVAKTQEQSLDQNNKDANALKTAADKAKRDSIQAVAKAAKTNSKKGKALVAATPSGGLADTLGTDKKSAKVKKVKGKSARQLRKEAYNNDPVNFTEKQIALIGFKNVKIDRSSLAPRPDISFSKARPYVQHEPNINDIKFFHRYWRDIDVLDQNNKNFGLHHAVLISSLLSAVKKKEITAYSPVAGSPGNPTGDAFTQPMKYTEMMAAFPDSTFVDSIDKVTGNNVGGKYVYTPFSPDKVYGYRIKEDVFYDKVRAVMVTRIIGIAPLIKIVSSTGEVLNIQPLCWLKFKDCRKVFVTIDVDPTKKIGTTMDDIFLQRRFYSRIVEESNPEGLRIKDYKTELAAQQAEADRIEKKVTKFKQGSWTYVTTIGDPEPEAPHKTATKLKKVKVKTPVTEQPKQQ